MIAVFFIVGVVVAGSLAWAGLVKQEVRVSQRAKWTGARAKAAGGFALFIALALLGATVWSIWALVNSK